MTVLILEILIRVLHLIQISTQALILIIQEVRLTYTYPVQMGLGLEYGSYLAANLSTLGYLLVNGLAGVTVHTHSS